ncbi:MAG TPA: PTS sugar transporter subunit IIA [Polyangiaceae bacterium]|nr:PTS sugar transporter subunit IIA [Polyangiaceae bacterium]
MQISVSAAATLLNTSDRKIYEWIRKGSIPFQKVGDTYRFHRAELLEWATGLGMTLAIEELPQSRRATDEPPTSFGSALRLGGVHRALEGRDRESVLSAIVAKLPLDDDADRELLYDVMLSREALGSTGIGDGIAIPHVRAPVVMKTTGASVTLCQLAQPIDFAAIDGNPVHSFFTLITPTIRSHLFLLSRLSVALQNPEFHRLVIEQAPADALFEVADALDRSMPSSLHPKASK